MKDRTQRPWSQWLAAFAGQLAVHVTGSLFMTVVLSAIVLDWHAGQLLLSSIFRDSAYAPDYFRLLIQVGLGSCAWALLIIGVLWARQTKKTRLKRHIRVARGQAATEFLIILVPYLLLTSGLAQLAILNVASVLAHVASYQSARTAWVWLPETTRPGRTSNIGEVQEKARIAAALVLAPTAPSDFEVSNVPGGDARAAQGYMTAMFSSGYVTGSSASTTIAGTGSAMAPDVQYYTALDTGTMQERAAAKFAYAYNATTVQVIAGGRVGTRLTYQMNIAFPWFQYIWGTAGSIAGRSGYFIPIRRQYTLEPQLLMN